MEGRAFSRYRGAMTRSILSCAALALFALPAAAQGPIGTLERGEYLCELPGHAAGPAGQVLPDAHFTIENASHYSTSAGQGTYLRRGDTLLLTSGPRQGESYAVISTRFLRQIDGGRQGRLRCIRKGR